MTCEVKIIADSTCANQTRITTFQLRYWRAIHGELMTHRVFSRNASSSRAVPVMKTLNQVWNDPAGPVHWGSNKAGMQAGAQLTGLKLAAARVMWKLAGHVMCLFAYGLYKLNLHKQVANRLLEPWQYISVVLTTTELDNFFALRVHPDAQPEMQELATAMKKAYFISKPIVRPTNRGNQASWHLPYVTDTERTRYSLGTLCMISAARCARVSFLTHDGKATEVTNDVGLFNKLVSSEPRHASPVEHQAYPTSRSIHRSGNFIGWNQWRQEL